MDMEKLKEMFEWIVNKEVIIYEVEDDHQYIFNIYSYEINEDYVNIYGETGYICIRPNCNCIGSWGWEHNCCSISMKELENIQSEYDLLDLIATKF